ncbi:MAG TPA: hypothetical protein VNW95_13190 [Mucilaginibacter sp.]|jgi:hypothetical protein|nr:hypothetical protein [Mucilaginibacter sp.]
MKIKIFCGAFFLLMLNAVIGFAQAGAPCAGGDVDGNCPLDTFVVVLAGIALVFGAVQLYRKGKNTPLEV